MDILGIAKKSMQQGAGTHIETTELKFWPCNRAPVPCLNFYLGSCKKGVFRLVTRQCCICASCPVINCGHRLISIMITFTSYYHMDLFIVEQTRAAYKVYVINQISLLFILRILWQNRACMSKYCPIYGQAKWPFDTSLIRMYPKILYFISIKIIQDQYTLLPLLGRSM